MNLAPKTEEFATAEMAEDPRYRANDPFARPQGARPQSARPASGGDPLAELARLIGQNDPFGDLNRAPPQAQRPGGAPSVDWRSMPPPDPFRNAQPAAPPAYTDPYAGHAAPQPAHATQRAQHAPAQHASAQQRAPEPQRNGQPYAGAPAGYPVSQADPYAQQGYDPAAYGQQQPGYDQESYETDPYYGEEQPQDGTYQVYEEAGAPRRRGGILTVLAVLALAIVGTAGAFGYRAVFGNSNALATPPVIRADGAPTKVVPATQAGEAQTSKTIYDRVGDRTQGEKVVAREEQPVEIREPVAPRMMFPGPASTASQGGIPANAAALAPAASTSPGGSEPKKVRTVTIRADQPNGSTAAPSPQATRNSQFPAAAVAATPEPVAPPAPRAARATAPAPSGNSPLSLSAPGAAPAPPAPRVASAAAPAPRASAAVDGGTYVQVSSQRSEAEAQSSFRGLQAKYPNVLGGQRMVIRRADLGDKGTYYRAQVGPFGNEQANQLCESLRSAGGQCVVQRN